MPRDLERFAVGVRKVEKPWGYELIWAHTDKYVGKILFVRAGHALSLQYHKEKDESWYLHEGRAELEMGELGAAPQACVVETGVAFHLTPGTVHRLRAIEDTLMLEVSTPHLEDVVRLEDRYGRAEPAS